MSKIYLDYNSTTPVHHEVLDAMLPYFTINFGNPSSTHSFGQTALHAMDYARFQTAQLIGARIDEIIFTSGGTESNNLAINGIAESSRKKGNHIITCLAEHSSVYGQCKVLEKKGFDVTYLPVNGVGLISMEDLMDAITDQTTLISIMLANNETGVIQEIKKMSSLAIENRIPFHTDAVQAAGKIPISVDNLGVDLLSLSGHKIYGPKGIGALFLRRGLNISPLLNGGGQENRKRSGTENIPGIVGLGKACEISMTNLASNREHLKARRDQLERGILEKVPCAKLNGQHENRVPNTLNMSFTGQESETLLVQLDLKGIAVSSGSACGSTHQEASRVLGAMGLPPKELYSSLRFSIGIHTSAEEIEETINTISDTINRSYL